MPKSRRSGRTSTPMLAIWGIVMLLLGVGVGFLFSGTGCDRKDRARAEAKEAAPKSARKSVPPPKAAKAQEPTPEPHQSDSKRDEPRQPEPKGREPKPELPRLALVIDDLGYAAPELVTRLCAQNSPFSVAVLPFQEFTKESAEIAHARGKEVLLHLPMEPIGYPGPSKDPGPGAVMFDLPESEMRLLVRKALDGIPHRKGVNNHMGSRITPDRKRMTWILEEIRAKQCFFLDSRTEKDSVAFDIAAELKIPAVQRKVFLDDDKSFEQMSKQWDRALGIARKEGQVVIIGHIYPETIEALERLIPRTKGEVTFVKAGELAK
jgi:polysaccharide deacetylase 2 family uncharacterized protein YibQ